MIFIRRVKVAMPNDWRGDLSCSLRHVTVEFEMDDEALESLMRHFDAQGVNFREQYQDARGGSRQLGPHEPRRLGR